MLRLGLLGDSTIDNKRYVGSGRDVTDWMFKLQPNSIQTFQFAKDGATIGDIYEQFELALATRVDAIVISVGGNDLLRHADLLSDVHIPSTTLYLADLEHRVRRFGEEYRQMLEHILNRPNAPIVAVCSIYNPMFRVASERASAQTLIRLFNDEIVQVGCTAEAKGLEPVDLIDLRTVCYKDKHFVNEIEPSERGGKKIAKAILGTISQHLLIGEDDVVLNY